jgi:hypothetical protein
MSILCLCVCLAGVSTCLDTLIKVNCLVKIFSLLCACFWHWRFINSHNLGVHLGYYIQSRKGGPQALLQGDAAYLWQPQGSVNSDNFLDL